MKQRARYSILIAVVCAGTVLWLASRTSPAGPKLPPTPPTVAVVDVHKLFTEYERSKSINTELKKKQDEAQAQLEQKLKQIEAKRAQLGNFRPDSKDYKDRNRELIQLHAELQSFKDISVYDAKNELRAMTETIYMEVIKAVEVFAKDAGYDLVIYRDEVKLEGDELPVLLDKIRQRKVIYASDSIDITEPVLQQLNQQYQLKSPKG